MSSYALGRTHAVDYLYNLSLDTALEYMRALTSARRRGAGRNYARGYVDALMAELSA